MSEEIQSLVEAIKSLKVQDDPFKDYVFPIVSSFFSALLGGVVAYVGFRWQDGLLFEKEKLNSANRILLAGTDAFQSLIAIKQNYYKELTEDPLRRAIAVPFIIGRFNRIEEPVSQISFIAPVHKKGKPNYVKWSQLLIIKSLFENYNLLLGVWERRNELDRKIKDILLSESKDGFELINNEIIRKRITATDLTKYIQLTENVIKLTDDLIIEFSDFLSSFPGYAKSKISVNRLKNYSSILGFNHTEVTREFCVRTQTPDLSSVQDLFGLSSEEINRKFSTGYEYSL